MAEEKLPKRHILEDSIAPKLGDEKEFNDVITVLSMIYHTQEKILQEVKELKTYLKLIYES